MRRSPVDRDQRDTFPRRLLKLGKTTRPWLLARERTMMMRAYDVMTARVAAIHPKATLGQAIDLMVDLSISGLPVIDISGALVGMLTDGDILRRTSASARNTLFPNGGMMCDSGAGTRKNKKARARIVEEVMTPELCTVQEETSAAEVARVVQARGIKRLPVLHGDKLIGIINRADLSRALGPDFGRELGSATAQDAAMKAAVQAALHRLPWAPCPLIDVTVEAGQVALQGALLNEQDRKTLCSAVATIPGVNSLTDHLIVPEPMNDMFPLPDDMVRPPKLYC